MINPLLAHKFTGSSLNSPKRFFVIVLLASMLHGLLFIFFENALPSFSAKRQPAQTVSIAFAQATPATTLSPHPTATSPIISKRTISAASHQSRDAAYLARWQDYIEQFGNDHYPAVALKHNLRGELRLLVAIHRDGSLQGVSVRQSSGNPQLDQAAIEIVKQAAPFEALTPEMAEGITVLEIIRTWQFRGKNKANT